MCNSREEFFKELDFFKLLADMSKFKNDLMNEYFKKLYISCT